MKKSFLTVCIWFVCPGCAPESNIETSSSSIPNPVGEIQTMYNSDWPPGGYTRTTSVSVPNVRMWYNLATQAEFFVAYPGSVPAQNKVWIFHSRSNSHLIYEVQLIPKRSDSSTSHLLLVETFKCRNKDHINSCINTTNEFFQTPNQDMLAYTNSSISASRGWLVGLRIMVAAVKPNEKVHVSNQYATFLSYTHFREIYCTNRSNMQKGDFRSQLMV